MDDKKLKTLLMALVILLMAVGTFLYMGSSFTGLWFLLAAVLLYFGARWYMEGKEATVELLIRVGRRLLVPVAGILIAIVIGAVVMLGSKNDPIVAYRALFYGAFVRNWHISVLNAAPLLFTGLSVALAFHAGLFNIGAEGQYYIGAMAATWLGLTVQLPTFLSLALIFILAAMLSAAWNIVPAFLKVKTGAHEVITTMMLAHVARYLSPIFIRANGGDPSTSDHAYVTDALPESNWLPRFNAFLPGANYRLHVGILIAIVVAILVYFLLYNTKIGFEIRAVGQNKDAARAQGISIGKNIMLALLLAGALAGMAGINQVVGLDHRLYENLSAGYGWNGISVALLAGSHPIGVIFTSLLWGALDAGGQYMARVTQTSNAIVEIIKGIILFLVVARYIYDYLGNRIRRARRRKEAAAKEAV
ncbi:MAG TPA: ABC transporter permease [Sediminispirochaeta sp.]|nr:ABC transporter permease [Sediminispirochaeta sp.]